MACRVEKINAPNGKPSILYDKLNKEYGMQKALDVWLMTQTKEFKSWFKDSKAVDENGEPIILYHIGAKNITKFDKNKQNAESKFGKGFYFGTSVSNINFYKELAKERGVGYDIYPSFLSIKNPSYENITVSINGEAFMHKEISPEVVKKGNDGIIGTFVIEGYTGTSVTYLANLRKVFKKTKLELTNAIKNDEYQDIIDDLQEKYNSDLNILREAKNIFLKNNLNIKKEDINKLIDDTILDLKDTEVKEEWIVFSSNQIKSLFNKGEFSKTDDNIYNQTAVGDQIMATDPIEALDNKLISLLSPFGVKVEQVNDFRDRKMDDDPIAMADIANKTIYIAKDRANAYTLPEEASHFIVELMSDDPVVSRLMTLVEGEEVYNRVKKRYGRIYNDNEVKLKKEAIGQALSNALVTKWKTQESGSGFIRLLKNLFNKVIYKLKKIFRSKAHNEFEKMIGIVASDVLKGETSKWKIDALSKSSEGILLQASSLQLESADMVRRTLVAANKEGEFNKEHHAYIYNPPGGKSVIFDSVTQGMTKIGYRPSQINQPMMRGGDIGTVVHAFMDAAFANKRFVVRSDHKFELTDEAKKDLTKIIKDNFGNEFIFMSEVIVMDVDNQIAGTIDLIAIDKNGDVHIYDFKTAGRGFENMDKYLIAKSQDFSLQLTLYREILEKVIGKGKVKSMNIVKLIPQVKGKQITDVIYDGMLEVRENDDYKKVLNKEERSRYDYNKEGTMARHEKVIAKAMHVVEKQIRVMENRPGDKKRTHKEIRLLQELKNSVVEKKRLHGFARFTRNLDLELNGAEGEQGLLSRVMDIEKALQYDIKGLNISDAAKTLISVDRYVNSYSPIIDDMLSELAIMNRRGEAIPEELLNALNRINLNIKQMDTHYYELGVKIFGKFLKDFLGDRNHPDNVAVIGKDLNIEETLKAADRDISLYSLWLNSMVESRDDVLQLVDMAVKYHREKARFRALKDKQELLAAREVLRRTNKNEDFTYERDFSGELTLNIRSLDGYNWGEFEKQKRLYRDSLYKKYNTTSASFANDLTVDSPKRIAFNKDMSKWFNDNMGQSWKKELANMAEVMHKDDLRIYMEENIYSFYNKDTNSMVFRTKTGSALHKPDDKYKYKDSLNSEQTKFLEVIWRIKKSIDETMPAKYKHSRLSPQLKKDWIETAKKDGLLKIWDNIVESVSVQPDDVGFASSMAQTQDEIDSIGKAPEGKQAVAKKVLTDERGRIVNFIPLYFVTKLKDKSRLSMDITANMIAYSLMGRDYAEMIKIIDLLEIGKDVISKRDVIMTDMFGRKVEEVVPTVHSNMPNAKYAKLDKRNATNTYKRYEKYLEMQVYGKLKKEGLPFKIGETDFTSERMIDFFGRYVAINSLALNVYSGINNLVLGSSLTRIEAFSGQFFNHKDLAYADKRYYGQLPRTLSQIGKVNPTDKLTLWNEFFNVLYDYDEQVASMNTDRSTRLGQLATTGSLFFMNHSGEHYMQTRTALALASQIKVKNDKGEEVSFFDAYEVVGNKLRLKKEFKGKVSGETVRQYINRVHYINHSLHGIYNTQDKSIIQQMAIGRLAIMFRKFIVPGVNRRFRKQDWIFEANQFHEGYYRTAGKFIWGIIKDLKKLEFHLQANWNDLTSQDKANIKRMLAELSYMAMVMTLTSITVMTDLGNDDDEWYANMIAYQANRLKSELFFYSNINESFRIMKSPAAAVDQAQRISEFFGSVVFAPFKTFGEELQGGRHKGMSRFQKGLIGIVPLYKTYDKIQAPQDQLKFFTN